ncbi:MAG: hypothetical protein QOG21_341 [Actinomycetota bacterium]|jgi:hypothetical protein|nr:hypothetical protein [Actinomycetota bacterium]
MRRTNPTAFEGDRRVAERRSVSDRRAAVRESLPTRRLQLRRQTDVLQQVGSPASSRRLRRRSIESWIEGGLS